ncbi:hypothetical protein CBL_12409 [Carabus blaptoides fortunei]
MAKKELKFPLCRRPLTLHMCIYKWPMIPRHPWNHWFADKTTSLSSMSSYDLAASASVDSSRLVRDLGEGLLSPAAYCAFDSEHPVFIDTKHENLPLNHTSTFPSQQRNIYIRHFALSFERT